MPGLLGVLRLPGFQYEIATEVADRDCRRTLPRVPILATLPAENGRLQAEIEKIDGGDCRDCRDCWDCQECRFCQYWRMLREVAGLPILPSLQAENGRLHAEIEKIAGTAQIADIGKIAELDKGAEIS